MGKTKLFLLEKWEKQYINEPLNEENKFQQNSASISWPEIWRTQWRPKTPQVFHSKPAGNTPFLT